MNKILVFLLTILSLNFVWDYVLDRYPDGLEKIEESIILSAEAAQKKNWEYYEDVFGGAKKTDEPKEEIVYKQEEKTILLELKGTVIGSPRTSCAIIEKVVSKSQNIYRLGDSIDGVNIIAMNRYCVTLDSNGLKQELLRNVQTNVIIREEKPVAMRTDDLFESKMKMIEKVLLPKMPQHSIDFADIMRNMRIKPFFDGGRCMGFQLSNINTDSIMSRIGLQEGDVIYSINGKDISDPLKAMQILYSAGDNNMLQLGVERKDEKFNIDYSLGGIDA